MREFFTADQLAWRSDPVHGDKIREAIVHHDAVTGTYTRLLEIAPGFDSKMVLKHDFDEITYLVEGELINTRTKEVYRAGSFAYFPKGTEHGPFYTAIGAKTLEFRHIKPSE
jgi:uncharacterized cupin superfamily protein